MPRPAPIIVYVHMVAAFAALALGTWQLARPEGRSAHKLSGWCSVVLMLTVAISSLWIPSFLRLGWIHLLTLVAWVSLPLAFVYICRGYLAWHAGAMNGLNIGGLLVAGIFTLAPGRLIGNPAFKGTWGY